MHVGGFVTGVLTLAALEVITSSPGAANRTAAIPTAAARLAGRLLDPDLALLPNFHDEGDGAPPLWRSYDHDAGSTKTNTKPGRTVTRGGRRVRSAPTNPTTVGGVVGPGI